MKTLLKYGFLWMPWLMFGQIQTYEYWFNDDYQNKIVEQVSNENTFNLIDNLDVSSLDEGIHLYSIHFEDVNNQWSSVVTDFFYKLPENEISQNNKINYYQYWFDDGYNGVIGVTVSPQQIFALDDTFNFFPVTNGLHSFSVRFRDENNLWSSISTSFFYKLPENVNTQNLKINQYEYWFEDEYSNKTIIDVTPQEIVVLDDILDVSTFDEGLHNFSIRFKDENDQWSSVSSNLFYKLPENVTPKDLKIIQYEYWFEDEYDNKISVDVVPQEIIILDDILDVSTFKEGLHNFSIRFKDENDQWSSVSSNFFYKLPENVSTPNLKINQYEYWFDEDYDNKVTMNNTPEAVFILDDLLDANTLANGIHTFNIRFKDELDQWTNVSTQFFYKNPENVTILRDVVEYQYWFDDDYDSQATVPITPDQVYALDTFVMPESFGLGLGFHDLNIRFKDSSGQWSSIVTDEFEITILLDNTSFENSLTDISVYPNPTSGSLSVNLNRYYDEVSIILSDLSGRLLSQEKYENISEVNFNLDFSPGMYILIVEHQNQRSVHKILKR